ncbi:MAG: DinB family protein [Gemmatimonadales bacterium]
MSGQLTRIRRLFEHDGWANAATLASVHEGPAPAAAQAWMAHLVASERLWLARLRQEPSALPVWPDPELDMYAAELAELQGEWTRFLDSIGEEDLGEGVPYRNSRGEFWTSTVGDILTHVVLHASYHRGQIASAIREAGGTPAYTDFIHAVRTGLIE